MIGTNIYGHTLYASTPKGYSEKFKIYHFRAVATDGSTTWYGENVSFIAEQTEKAGVLNTFFPVPF